MNQEKMLELRRKHAISTNQDRWSITAPGGGRNREYSNGVDKDGLSKDQRSKIEAIKDKATYPEDADLF